MVEHGLVCCHRHSAHEDLGFRENVAASAAEQEKEMSEANTVCFGNVTQRDPGAGHRAGQASKH